MLSLFFLMLHLQIARPAVAAAPTPDAPAACDTDRDCYEKYGEEY
jgi:hypothetical protein